MTVDGNTGIDIGPSLASWAIIAAAGILPALVLWVGHRPRWPLLPRTPHATSPWNFFDLLLVLVLTLAVELALGQALGAHSLPKGPERTARALLVMLGRLPITFAIVLLVPRWTQHARLRDFGLTTECCRHNVVLGYLAWLVIAPLILGLFWLVSHFLGRMPHDVEQFLERESAWQSWLLAALATLLAAPLLEELVFRGFMQPGLAKTPLACDLVILGAATLLLSRFLVALSVESGPDEGLHPSLVLLSVALGIGYIGLCYVTRGSSEQNHRWRGIVATSVLFAAIHPEPSWIPLFVLAVALGWLRDRTGSLVGPILAHLLVNAVAMLQMGLKQTGAL
jgi:membrane protease YdiL (CAAX protease family)